MDIRTIKENAKAALRMRYWPMVGIELLAGALVGGGRYSFGFSVKSDGSDLQNFLNDLPFGKEISSTVVMIGMLAAMAGLVYVFLFGNVIRVGISGIRLSTYRQQGFKIVDLFKGLKQYKRMVGTMALETLFISLGFCCFIVPGIIVALGLFEVPFLLNEDSELSGMAAIRRSWEDMKGYKGRLFGFGLSFFGWIVLTALTCGVLAIFYVGPYMSIAEAGFFHERQALLEKEREAAVVMP